MLQGVAIGKEQNNKHKGLISEFQEMGLHTKKMTTKTCWQDEQTAHGLGEIFARYISYGELLYRIYK